MAERKVLERLRDCVVDLDTLGAERACREALTMGIPPVKVISAGVAIGLDIVGKKYETREYFLSELLTAGEVAKDCIGLLEPHMRGAEAKALGRVVIGTVRGDVHDIGKNIVATLLKAAGLEVIDLGTDVPPQEFVEAVRKNNPQIIAMSALLTTSMPEMSNTIRMLKKTGLRSKVKIIIGGAPITTGFAKKIGADHAAKDAVEGVNICKGWISATPS